MNLTFSPDDQEPEIIRIAEWIVEDYLTIGTTGCDAIIDCMSDLVSGRLNVAEWETDDETIFRAIALVGMKLRHIGDLHEVIGLGPVA